MSDDRDDLIEAATTAWRPRDADGRPRAHPAFCDLDRAGRAEAFRVVRQLRALEAALDPEGLSTTVRAVLGRLGR